MYIDETSIFVNNTAGIPDAKCPHQDGHKSEYCADNCTPVFGGGALYIGMAGNELCVYVRTMLDRVYDQTTATFFLA